MHHSWLIGRPSLRLHREESNLQVNRRASLCMSYKRSLNKVATHTHTRVYTHIHSLNQICLPHTPTYVAAVLVDGARAGREPHLPKCRHWTDCVGWWMADQGSAGVRRKQLVPCWSLLSSSALHPSLILLLALPPLLFQSIIVSLFPSHHLDPAVLYHLLFLLLHCLSVNLQLISISINMHLEGTEVNE